MEKKKRISLLVVSQYYYPEQFRINDICIEWAKRGYDVTVLTGTPNYPQGKFYDGFGWFKRRVEVYEKVRILRLPIVARGSSKVKLGLNYLSFVVSGFFWSLFTQMQADLVFSFEVSPMTQVLPAVWFAKRHNIPCVVYVQDLWPESFEVATGIHTSFIIKSIRRMCEYIYKNCQQIFVTSNSFKAAIMQSGVPEEKIIFWPQYSEDFYQPQKVSSVLVPEDKRFTVVFTGNIGMSQGLDILPKAADYLKRRDIKIRYLIVGEGRGIGAFRRSIHDNDVADYFLFIPQQAPQAIPGILAASDVAFISFSDVPLFRKTIPAKLQSYMACGVPIVAAVYGETRDIIESADAGLCVDPGDFQALAEVIKKLSEEKTERMVELSMNAKRYASQHFNKEQLMNKICSYIEKLIEMDISK